MSMADQLGDYTVTVCLVDMADPDRATREFAITAPAVDVDYAKEMARSVGLAISDGSGYRWKLKSPGSGEVTAIPAAEPALTLTTVEGAGMSASDFAAKVDYEGGITDALDYGLHATDLADQTSDLAKAWQELENLWNQQVQPLIDRVTDLLPEPSDDDEDEED